jgi:hypothetical protein
MPFSGTTSTRLKAKNSYLTVFIKFIFFDFRELRLFLAFWNKYPQRWVKANKFGRLLNQWFPVSNFISLASPLKRNNRQSLCQK